MILSDSAILAARSASQIVITPFDEKCLGSNSYDVHLSEHLAIYNSNADPELWGEGIIDPKVPPEIRRFKIPASGMVLRPGTLYLGSTVEYTETHGYIPNLNGKSSTGRLGIFIHVTAGQGDVGFCGYWTLEIIVAHSIILYPGMVIGQLSYSDVKGVVLVPYGNKANAKYRQQEALPQPSQMWKNFGVQK